MNTRAKYSRRCSPWWLHPGRTHLRVHGFLLPGSSRLLRSLLFPEPVFQRLLPPCELVRYPSNKLRSIRLARVDFQCLHPNGPNRCLNSAAFAVWRGELDVIHSSTGAQDRIRKKISFPLSLASSGWLPLSILPRPPTSAHSRHHSPFFPPHNQSLNTPQPASLNLVIIAFLLHKPTR